MKKIYIAIAALTLTFAACNKKADEAKETATIEEVQPETETTVPTEEVATDDTVFAPRALSQEFLSADGTTTTLQQIVEKHKGHAIVIDVWASWCPDCIKALPTMKEIKKEFTTVAFVNLSLDKTQEAWKESIAKHEIGGEHYFSTEGKGMKGDFGKALKLNWIPRYIVVDKEGKIALFNATEKNFDEIKDLLKKIQ
ncbi:MAG: TlpA family protein disulfide reductase [Flavobacteriaceae bacterium]|jgi:thiol-disulfide isomerase/thioredoxin|nr:TlpA family protein disulfide reductase [Flavobacteriaceae bacterium]